MMSKGEYHGCYDIGEWLSVFKIVMKRMMIYWESFKTVLQLKKIQSNMKL